MSELTIRYGLLEGSNINKYEFHYNTEGDMPKSHGIKYCYDSYISALTNFCFNVRHLVIKFRFVIFYICIRSSQSDYTNVFL